MLSLRSSVSNVPQTAGRCAQTRLLSLQGYNSANFAAHSWPVLAAASCSSSSCCPSSSSSSSPPPSASTAAQAAAANSQPAKAPLATAIWARKFVAQTRSRHIDLHSSRSFSSTSAAPKKTKAPRPKDELLKEATHHDVPVRRKAIRGLGKHRDDEQAIKAIAHALGDEDVAVQLAAQYAMGKVAEKGDERIVQATLEKTSSKCEWTRIAALSTLADITEPFGHPTRGSPLDLQVDEAVKRCLKDEDWGVRRAAIDTTAKRAQPNCPDAIEEARALLQDQMGTVRESAIKAIAALVPTGSRDAVDWIAPRLDDWHESVRRAAVVCIAKIAKPGDQHAIELEKTACNDRSWIVRKAATDSLAKTATVDDLASLRKLATMLEDFDPLPRMAAIYGIAELCGVGHRKAIKLAEARLEHRDAGTRQACVQLLEKIATQDMTEIIRKVQERMEDEDEHVRDSAYYALEAIKKTAPERRRWLSDLPDLGDLDRLGFESSDDEGDEGA